MHFCLEQRVTDFSVSPTGAGDHIRPLQFLGDSFLSEGHGAWRRVPPRARLPRAGGPAQMPPSPSTRPEGPMRMRHVLSAPATRGEGTRPGTRAAAATRPGPPRKTPSSKSHLRLLYVITCRRGSLAGADELPGKRGGRGAEHAAKAEPTEERGAPRASDEPSKLELRFSELHG